jgi:hypothetical protein
MQHASVEKGTPLHAPVVEVAVSLAAVEYGCTSLPKGLFTLGKGALNLLCVKPYRTSCGPCGVPLRVQATAELSGYRTRPELFPALLQGAAFLEAFPTGFPDPLNNRRSAYTESCSYLC